MSKRKPFLVTRDFRVFCSHCGRQQDTDMMTSRARECQFDECRETQALLDAYATGLLEPPPEEVEINWATHCPICGTLRDPKTEVWRYSAFEDGRGTDPSVSIDKVIFCSLPCLQKRLPHEHNVEARSPHEYEVEVITKTLDS